MSALRADARRNLGRVLDAAAEAFAELGPDVPVAEIARRAGVGYGTVFRRFPTKEALLAAVVEARLDELVAWAEELLDAPDAGAAFDTFVWHVAESCRCDRLLYDAAGRCDASPGVIDAKARLHAALDRLIAKAAAQGSLRADVHAEDVGTLVGSAVQSALRGGDADAWRRYVEIVLAGLRPR